MNGIYRHQYSYSTTFSGDKVGFRTSKGQAHFDNLLFTNSQTERSLYALGNQTIATRVSGDPVSTNNGLFYIFSDHLGSTSVLATSTGNQVPGSRATYYPFGSPRTAPTQTITDRNFTGQKENLELGLIYFNARYYLPNLARFLTPDTLVPDPANPQQFNRYTYVLNNPLKFTDPAGHCAEAGDEACWSEAEKLSQQYGMLEWFGKLSYWQLTNNVELARVLAYSLMMYNQVLSGAMDGATAMIAILAYAIDEVAGGHVINGTMYAASVFYRKELGARGLVYNGYDIKKYTKDEEQFPSIGFASQFQGHNQVEHFINEAYVAALITIGGIAPTELLADQLFQWWENKDENNPEANADYLLGTLAVNYVRNAFWGNATSAGITLYHALTTAYPAPPIPPGLTPLPQPIPTPSAPGTPFPSGY